MCGVGGLTGLLAWPANRNALAAEHLAGRSNRPAILDLREFVRWITSEFEPSVRLGKDRREYASGPGRKENALYGVSDMADILYTVGALDSSQHEREMWAESFAEFQVPESGWYIEKPPNTLSPEHNTAFVLGAMQLLDLKPRYPVKLPPKYQDIRTFLHSLSWHTNMYPASHKGAGIGSICALVPELHSTSWFAEYFATCDSFFDAHNGLMGADKPVHGDIDQIGGTFHYAFLYEYFRRRMPYPEQRIDSILGLQQADGYWSPANHLWMTLDAIFLMTRTLRYCPHRIDGVRASVRKALTALNTDVYSAEGRKKTFSDSAGVHTLTSAISIAAEAQQFLGSQEIVTEWPLRLVLDRRPFI
jgi:hypothetical protein